MSNKNIFEKPGLYQYEYGKRPNPKLEPKFPNNSQRESAPFTEKDVEPIIDILMRCPEENMFSRAFRQHSDFGTCWYDSFFMMVFESIAFKPNLGKLLDSAFRALMEKNIFDLSYIFVKEKTVEEYEAEIAQKKKNEHNFYRNILKKEPPAFNSSYIQKEIRNVSLKNNIIAEAFIKEFGYEDKNNKIKNMPIYINVKKAFQLLAHTIHKYMLLGYLFYKTEIQEKTIMGRRKSVNATSFEYLHSCLRMSFYFNSHRSGILGTFKEDTSNFLVMMKILLEIITNNSLMLKLNDSSVKIPLGYYFTVVGSYINEEDEAKMGKSGHVVSFIKCKTWSFYNNEYGVVPFNAEDSVHIDAVGIESLTFVSDIASRTTKYTVTLFDKAQITFETDVVTGDDGKLILYDMTEFKAEEAFVLCPVESKGGSKKKQKTRKIKKYKK